jgi:hypothetical protein
VTRPRAADDFATIRARMEELRREREPASKNDSRDTDPGASGGRSLLKVSESRQRLDSERWSNGSSSRRYGSGR